MRQGEIWQDWNYGVLALAAVGAAAGWGLLFAVKLSLGFALKQVAHLYVRHYDQRHTKSRCARVSHVAEGCHPRGDHRKMPSWRWYNS